MAAAGAPSSLSASARAAAAGSPGRARTVRLAALGCLVALLAVAGTLTVRTRVAPPAAAPPRPTRPLPAQHAVAPATPAALRNADAVARALGFLRALQPEGTYVLTTRDADDVVPMDLAHAVIALTKLGSPEPARAALDWLLARMTLPDDAGSGASAAAGAGYAGSWWDHFRRSGEPRTELTRGRGEGVGMALIATYVVQREDPDYLRRELGAVSVADRLALAVGYLTSPAMQQADGRFSHRPDYRVSFNEEGARMSLGLRLAAEMLERVGRREVAALAAARAELGLAALARGAGLSQGMAYDHYALGIWGLATPAQSRAELDALARAGLLTPAGVRNWDWQSQRASGLGERLRWWAQGQSVSPSETFDWAIASLGAGEAAGALRVERRWLALQRPDGSFPDAYVPALGVAFGPSTSYAAARFLLLERLLAEALGG